MGFRFGKRIKICKGINLNVSSKGVGISAGVRGFRVSSGPNGNRITASIPGTGISYSENFSNNRRSSNRLYAYSELIESTILGKQKIIKANSSWELQLLKENQIEKWKIQEERFLKREKVKDLKMIAELKTEEAKKEIEEHLNILNYTLDIDDCLDWNSQKDNEKYHDFSFEMKEPSINLFIQQLNVPDERKILEFIFKKLKEKRILLENKAKDIYLKENDKYLKLKQKALEDYEKNKEEFYNNQKKYNNNIDRWKNDFEVGEKQAVEKYIEVIFSNSNYPEKFEREYEIDYFKLEKNLLISLKIPNPNEISKIKEYKYSPTKQEIINKEMLKTEFANYYKSIIFQTVLRTLHEVFEGVYIKNILEKITLNIWTEKLDESIGVEELKCILSIECLREEFEKINLEKIEVEECLKFLNARYNKNFIKLEEIIPYFEIQDEE